MVSVVEGITHRHVEQAALCTWCLGSAASGARTSRPTASNLTPTGCSARSSGAMRACCVRDNHGPDVGRGGGGSLHAGRRWELVWPSSQQRWRQAAFYRAQASHLARRASCTCVQRMQVDVGVDGVALGLAAARGGAWDVDLLVGCAGGCLTRNGRAPRRRLHGRAKLPPRTRRGHASAQPKVHLLLPIWGEAVVRSVLVSCVMPASRRRLTAAPALAPGAELGAMCASDAAPPAAARRSLPVTERRSRRKSGGFIRHVTWTRNAVWRGPGLRVEAASALRSGRATVHTRHVSRISAHTMRRGISSTVASMVPFLRASLWSSVVYGRGWNRAFLKLLRRLRRARPRNGLRPASERDQGTGWPIPLPRPKRAQPRGGKRRRSRAPLAGERWPVGASRL
jgi:hypothetical protein